MSQDEMKIEKGMYSRALSSLLPSPVKLMYHIWISHLEDTTSNAERTLECTKEFTSQEMKFVTIPSHDAEEPKMLFTSSPPRTARMERRVSLNYSRQQLLSILGPGNRN